MLNDKIKAELKRRLNEKKTRDNFKANTDKKFSTMEKQLKTENDKKDELEKINELRFNSLDNKIDSLFAHKKIIQTGKEIFIGNKKDGIPCQVHFENGETKIWDNKGSDITEKLPTIVKQFKSKKGSFILLGELELYHGKKLMSKDNVESFIEKDKCPEERNIIFTIYDQLYSISDEVEYGDIHKKPYDFRRREYLKIKETENIKICKKEVLIKDEKSLMKHIENNNEKIILKLANSPYSLSESPGKLSMVKFKKENKIPKKIFSKIINLKNSDFSKNSGKSVLAKDIKFPYTFETVSFSEGTWHETFYPWDVIKEAAPKIMDAEGVTFHVGPNDDIRTKVGKVIDYKLDETNKRLITKIELFDTSAGRDVAVLHANKQIHDVSVRINEESDMGECKKITAWPHIAFVREGEVADAKVCYGKTCQ